MQRGKRTKMIRLDLDVYEELTKAKGELTAKEGRPVTLSEVVRQMIGVWREKARGAEKA
jgi:predicted CopG family antitoxin